MGWRPGGGEGRVGARKRGLDARQGRGLCDSRPEARGQAGARVTAPGLRGGAVQVRARRALQGLSVWGSGRQFCRQLRELGSGFPVRASRFRSDTAGGTRWSWPPGPPRRAPPQPRPAAPASDSGRPPLPRAPARGRGGSPRRRGWRSGPGDCDGTSSDGRRSCVPASGPPTDPGTLQGRSRCHLAARPSPGSEVGPPGPAPPKTAAPGELRPQRRPRRAKCAHARQGERASGSLAAWGGRPGSTGASPAAADPQSCPPGGSPSARDPGARAVRQGNGAVGLCWLPQASAISHMTLWNLIITLLSTQP